MPGHATANRPGARARSNSITPLGGKRSVASKLVARLALGTVAGILSGLLLACGGSVRPRVVLTASPTSIMEGQSTTLTWSSTNATSCTASGAWSGSQATSGTATETPTATGTDTYTLTCTGAGGSANQSVTLTVNAASAPTVLISVNPATITLGNSATLTWSATNATSCTASGAWSGSQATSGTQTVTPSVSGTDSYEITCSGAGGNASSTAVLTVNAAAPTVTIAVNPTTITLGSSATLTWSSTNADSCTASGAWSGSQATSGTATETPTAVGSYTYTLTCTGAGGPTSQSATLTVNAPASQGFVYTLNSAENIAGFSESAADGTLTLLGDSPYSTNVVTGLGLTVDAPLNLIFASGALSSSQPNGAIAALAIDPATGSLSAPMVTLPVSGDQPNAPVAIGPSGNYIYVSTSTESVAAYSVAANGTLAELTGSPFAIPGINCGLFCSPSANGLLYDANDTTLYVASENAFVIANFTVDTLTGALTWQWNTPAHFDPNAVAIDPSGKFLYATNTASADISAYTITPTATSGGNPEPLTPIAGSPFAAGTTPNSLAVEPTGHFLYVNNSGDNTISVYSIDGITGALTPIGGSPFPITNGAGGNNQLTIDPSGQYLYVASRVNQGTVSAFSINPTTGALTQLPNSPYTTGTGASGPFAITVYKPGP